MNIKEHSKDNISVLVVDDEEAIRDILNHAMQQSGFRCVTAADGREALDILAEYDIDVIITDIQMPNLNGIELTKIVKEKYDSDVIMMTGFVRDYTYEEIIEKGASDFVQKPVSIKELIIRVKRVLKERELLRERIRAVDALRESERRYRELSIKDGLTGLYNSRHFFEKLHEEISRSKRYNNPLTLLMFDVDNFKQYNDTYGHLEGDKVLVRIADVTMRSIRCTDSAYRYGGEEFAILLSETEDDQGAIVAERIRIDIKNEAFSPETGKTVRITVSVGIAQFIPQESPEEFVRRADSFMYEAKMKGKDRVSMSLLHRKQNPSRVIV